MIAVAQVVTGAWVIAGWTLPACGGSEATVDFAAEIAPILQRNCLNCHGAGEAEAGVSLATRGDLESQELVVPGNPDDSYLLEVISASEGARPAMPKDRDPLSDDEISRVRRWIAQGTEWPAGLKLEPAAVSSREWWSLEPIVVPETPDSGGGNPVDGFIHDALARRGLTAVEQADPRTLIRRVTYDLTGLPPRPADIDRFLSDAKGNFQRAWRRLIDRLLASPAFGEKWGQHWLDLARYAETHGYDKDKPRPNAWPYRDYVIRSFNDDTPYPRFVREQVAGDVLYPHDPEGVVGLGFLAAGPWDFIGHWEVGEGKLDGRIAKHLDRDEMVSAVFNVFLSTTVQCARCHHHKFDPVRMEDYYRLHAVFAAVDRADRVYEGLSDGKREQQMRLTEQLREIEEKRDRIETRIERELAARVSGIDRRLSELRERYGTTLQPEYGYHSAIAEQPEVTKWVQVDLGQPRAIAEIRLIPAFDRFADIGAGFGFPVRFRVEASDDPEFAEESVRLLLDATGADHANPGSRPVTWDGDAISARYIRVTATRLAERQGDYIFALGELEAIEANSGKNVARDSIVTAMDSIESGERWGAGNLTDGVFYQELSDARALREFRDLLQNRAAIARELRPPEVEARLAELKARAAELRERLDAFPEGQKVYAAATHFPGGGQFEATGGEPRPIHLLRRGDLRAPEERLFPGPPKLWDDASRRFSGEAQNDEGRARAELARYLTRRDNPLVWRSIANRVWQWTFGRGLVDTPNDFGRMGGRPSHPELLDYLAARLRDDPNGSIKSLVRLLVTSDAYRRASRHDAANSSKDANNRYLWRFNRRRLTAEEFRDSILAVSGVLRRSERGGPSFRDFVIEKPQHSPHYQYHLHDPDDASAYRRTIYRFVVRSQPQPMLTALDCADPSISVPKRDESTTSLQALTQWNHRLVEATCRRFAARMNREAPSDTCGRVAWACRVALGRGPDQRERRVLRGLLEEHGEATLARVLMNTSAFTYVD